MKPAVFYLALGMLFTHEIDAMPNHEWRGMPILGAMPDDVAMTVFTALHVPLFAGLIALVASRRAWIRGVSRLALTAFIVIHGVLHGLSMGRPGYEFSSVLSQTLIFGGAALGAVYVLLELRDRLRS